MTVAKNSEKQVAYGTKLMSIPVPLEKQVKGLKQRYKGYWKATGNANHPPLLLGSENRVVKYKGKKLKGGKNKDGQPDRAPYESKLVRVPLPIEAQVNELVLRYMGYIQAGGNVASPIDLLGDVGLPNPPFTPLVESSAREIKPELTKEVVWKEEYLERFDRIVSRFEAAVNKLVQFSEKN